MLKDAVMNTHLLDNYRLLKKSLEWQNIAIV